ncbi:MAG TPA: hypothetical protein DEP53_06895 [Bacteroidetes bacterium]|nr:hypothetical protein [Bacteroidota bacterium]
MIFWDADVGFPSSVRFFFNIMRRNRTAERSPVESDSSWLSQREIGLSREVLNRPGSAGPKDQGSPLKALFCQSESFASVLENAFIALKMALNTKSEGERMSKQIVLSVPLIEKRIRTP